MIQESVTVVITRNVRAGLEREFESTVEAWIPQALTYPGHLGVHMLRPAPGGHEYGAVLKFRNQRDWAAFQNATEYLQFLSRIEKYLEGSPHVETVSGLETWFTPLGSRLLNVPPRWKMALVTWFGVCVAVYGVQALLVPFMGTWPFLLSFAVGNGIVVALLTWLIMPGFSRLLQPWLLPANHAPISRESSLGKTTAHAYDLLDK